MHSRTRSMGAVLISTIAACAGGHTVDAREQALDNGDCSGSCCTPGELESLSGDTVLVIGDMTLCAGQVYELPFSIQGSGSASDYLTLDCNGSTIWGGEDVNNLENESGIKVIGDREYVEIVDCVVAGWSVGIEVWRSQDAHQPGAGASPELGLPYDAGTPDAGVPFVFDHNDLALPAVPEHINLTNVTVHRNRYGLDYQARDSTISGLRAYKNRGHGVHIRPHARDITFDKNGVFSLNVYDNGHPEVPGCAAGSLFTLGFCDALNKALVVYLAGIAIDSAHNITIQNGTVNNNGRHGISIYKNCGEQLASLPAYHRRSITDRNIDIVNMSITNHTQGWQPGHTTPISGYEISFEMVSSAGVMIGGRQGLRLAGQNGCHDVASYVFSDDTGFDDWNDITFLNATNGSWHHWDFAQGVRIAGGTIAANTIGVHVADSNASLEQHDSTDINLWGNAAADVFVGNYIRDVDGHKVLALTTPDTLVGAPPVKNVDLSGVAGSDTVACSEGTETHSTGVLNGSCDLVKGCVEEVVAHPAACGSR